MEINFKGKTAIITGATQGIGYSIASMLIRENCHVIYTGRSKTPESILEGGIYSQLDLTDQNSCENFIENVISRSSDLGRLIGVENAEGFTTNRVIGINNLNDLK